VTRFPAADPSKAENFYIGASPSGLNIDSQGNVWVTTRFGNGMLGKLHLADMDLHGKFEGLVPAMDFALIQGAGPNDGLLGFRSRLAGIAGAGVRPGDWA
jgi:hypothetical protein